MVKDVQMLKTSTNYDIICVISEHKLITFNEITITT